MLDYEKFYNIYKMNSKEVVLKLPDNYVIDSVYDKSSPKQNAFILDIGCLILKNTPQIVCEPENRNDEEIERLKNLNLSYIETIKELKAKSERVNNTDEIINAIRNMKQSDDNFTMIRDELKQLGNKLSVKPVVKGRDNEIDTEHFIINHFSSPGSGFLMKEKTERAGDHIFSWNDIKLMWEDKDYVRVVPQAEVDKAHRDFKEHQECDVLLFVSANSNIIGHEVVGGVDIRLIDKRIAIYISCFKQREDKDELFRNILQPLILNLVPFIKSISKTTPETILNEKISSIIALLRSRISDFNEHYNRLQSFMKDMKSQWTLINDGLIKLRASLVETLKFVVKDISDDEDEDDDKAIPTKGKRKCGICGQFGHIRKTCPERSKK